MSSNAYMSLARKSTILYMTRSLVGHQGWCAFGHSALNPFSNHNALSQIHNKPPTVTFPTAVSN